MHGRNESFVFFRVLLPCGQWVFDKSLCSKKLCVFASLRLRKYNFLERYTVSADFGLAIFTQINSIDNHILRSTKFLDKMQGFFKSFNLGTEFDVSYELKKSLFNGLKPLSDKIRKELPKRPRVAKTRDYLLSVLNKN